MLLSLILPHLGLPLFVELVSPCRGEYPLSLLPLFRPTETLTRFAFVPSKSVQLEPRSLRNYWKQPQKGSPVKVVGAASVQRGDEK